MLRESKASIVFRHYLKAHPMPTASFEIKQTTTNSLPFSAVTQPQIDYGMAIKSKKGVLLRVQAVAEGMPDYIWMRGQPAYVVIFYPKAFYIIDIETFDMEKKRSQRKSLTPSRANDIAIITVPLK
jgi:hypothetical protein